MNKSGITPLRDLILVLPEEDVTRKDALIELPDSVLEKQKFHKIFGVVIDIGEGAFKYEKKQYGVEPALWPGDRIMFAKYSGLSVKGADGVSYRMIRDDDVLATVSVDVKQEVE